MNLKLIGLTAFSLFAFAGNSLLCRMALKHTAIDPATFVTIRLVSGAVMLWLIFFLQKKVKHIEGNWWAASALFAYAALFAFAYAQISAGTGALLLFASIQISMILYGLWIGERFSKMQMMGLLLALGGLSLLLRPSMDAPPIFNGVLMIFSGVAWGAYSLLGRVAKDPSAATAGNFIRAMPIAIGFYVVCLYFSAPKADDIGVAYAIASGAVTSGLGYILWYAALKQLRVTHAATVQLSVPVLASIGGVIFLGEPITKVLVVATFLIIIGVAFVLFFKKAVR